MLVRTPARQTLFILLTAALVLTSCNMGATPAPTVDANAISTAAYNTAVANISIGQTQTALAAPSATLLPTNTPLSLVTFPPADGSVVPGASTAIPTFSFNTTGNTTPAAGTTPLVTAGVPAAGQKPTLAMGDACHNSAFEGDVTIPDGTVIDPGVNFTKSWKLRNTGSCKWDEGYSLVYIGGSSPDLDPYDYKFSKTSDRDFVASGEAIDVTVELTAPCTPGKYEGHWRMKDDQGNFFGTFVSVYIEVTKKDKKCGK